MPSPITETVFSIELSRSSGANWFVLTLYTIIAVPPAGIDIPVIVSGGPTVTVGVF